MTLEALVASARQRSASDLHIEPNLAPVIRTEGRLEAVGPVITPTTSVEMARRLLDDLEWSQFLHRRSFDLSRTICGVRCRLNILHSIRGVGLAVRLLASVQPTLEALNVHPDLRLFVENLHGLMLVSGATGSGKSSTLAALIHEINLHRACHIVTIEEPVEYVFAPRVAFVRQRQVGHDTPSFEQGLLDVLREDPDVIMVGEMRQPEVMRLTLNAAETGHLTFATVHSSNSAEALQRIVSSFPAEIQSSVSAQLADCLLGVVCQRLVYHPEVGLRVPELEVLVATAAVRNLIRQGHFFKLASTIETGAKDGMWSFERYRQWMDAKPSWHDFENAASEPAARGTEPVAERPSSTSAAPMRPDGAFAIEPPGEDFSKLLSELRPRP